MRYEGLGECRPCEGRMKWSSGHGDVAYSRASITADESIYWRQPRIAYCFAASADVSEYFFHWYRS